jgi:hypothetical protein
MHIWLVMFAFFNPRTTGWIFIKLVWTLWHSGYLRLFILNWIWGSHCSKWRCLLGYHVMKSSGSSPVFQRNILSPSWGPKRKPSAVNQLATYLAWRGGRERPWKLGQDCCPLVKTWTWDFLIIYCKLKVAKLYIKKLQPLKSTELIQVW